MKIHLRLEAAGDYAEVENLTREAFWNIHCPGCSEHLLVHNLRSSTDFIPELDYVALSGERLIGNILYTHSKIVRKNGSEVKTITFGPLSVLPEYQRTGVGSELVRHTLKLARELGHRAVIIFGDPEYYKRFGFAPAKCFGIRTEDGKFAAAHLALPLYEGALDHAEGNFYESPLFEVSEAELLEFDRKFTRKEKGHTASQERFEYLCSLRED